MSISAQVLKIGFLLGYFDKKNISDWAEKQLNENEDNELTSQLVLSNPDSEVISLLNGLSSKSNYDKSLVNEYFLGFFNSQLTKQKDEWRKCENEMLRYFSLDEFSLNEDDKLFISRLNNDASLRNEGFGGTMDMPLELSDYLKNHNKFVEIQSMLFKEGIPYPNYR